MMKISQFLSVRKPPVHCSICLTVKRKMKRFINIPMFFLLECWNNCYDLDKKSRREGQIINYIYDFKNKYGNVPQSCPPDNELKDSWNKLSVSLQWSNLYSAYSISPKLRSIGITDGYVKLDNDQITFALPKSNITVGTWRSCCLASVNPPPKKKS